MEVLLVVALTGLVVSAISAAFIVVLRAQPETEARASDARSLLGISTWLPADVSSAPQVTSSDLAAVATHWNLDPAAASGCSTSDRGINLVTLRWDEQLTGSLTTYRSSYRYVDAGGWVVQRVACTNGGAPTVQSLTSTLPSPSACPTAAGSAPSTACPAYVELQSRDGTIVGLRFRITTADGDILRVDATSNNPAAHLPDAPTPDTPIAPVPPALSEEPLPDADPDAVDDGTVEACTVGSIEVTPATVDNQRGSGAGGSNREVGSLTEPVTVVVARSGDCSGLGVEYVTDALAEPVTVRWKVFGDSRELVLPALEIERWRDGLHDLIVRNGQDGAELRRATLQVR